MHCIYAYSIFYYWSLLLICWQTGKHIAAVGLQALFWVPLSLYFQLTREREGEFSCLMISALNGKHLIFLLIQ